MPHRNLGPDLGLMMASFLGGDDTCCLRAGAENSLGDQLAPPSPRAPTRMPEPQLRRQVHDEMPPRPSQRGGSCVTDMPQACVFNFCDAAPDDDDDEELRTESASPFSKDLPSFLLGGRAPPVMPDTSSRSKSPSRHGAGVTVAAVAAVASQGFSKRSVSVDSSGSGTSSHWSRNLAMSDSPRWQQAPKGAGAAEITPTDSTNVSRKAKELREILDKQSHRLRELERGIAAHKRVILGEAGGVQEVAAPPDQVRKLARQQSGESSKPDATPSSRQRGEAPPRRPAGASSRPVHSLRPVLPAWAGTANHLGVVDKDLVQALYDKPYHEASSHRGAKVFGVVFGLMALPFGPIGMVASGMVGALCGSAAGYCLDRRTARAAVQDSVATERRLKSLVRWADAHVYDTAEVLRLIEMVTLEFRPIADMAATSQNARKLLRLLDGWVSQRSTTRHIWLYMDQVLWSWRDLSRSDFVNAMRVFQVLVANFQITQRELNEEEADLLQRMERLLGHTSVRAVLQHSELHPRKQDTEVMQSMVYADQEVNADQQVDDAPDPRTPRSASARNADEGGPGLRLALCLDEEERVPSRGATPSRSAGCMPPLLLASPHARDHMGSALPLPPALLPPPLPPLIQPDGGKEELCDVAAPIAPGSRGSPKGNVACGTPRRGGGGDDGYSGAGLGMGRSHECEGVGGKSGDARSFAAHFKGSPSPLSGSPKPSMLPNSSHPALGSRSQEDSRASSKDSRHVGTPRSPRRSQFFKSWDDFMDFDLKIKHRMPITTSEFDFLVQKEAESNKNWNIVADRKDLTVSTVLNKTGGITLRAWATMEGVDVHVAFRLFHDIGLRVMWDKTFEKMHLIDDGSKGKKASDILYCVLKIPTVTARDFLQYRRVLLQEDGSILVVLRSAENPSMPEQKKFIRAESFIQGYVFRQRMVGGVPSTDMFTIIACDVKGMIPKWIVNFVAPRRAGDFVTALKKAALEYQRANPLYKRQLSESMKRFGENGCIAEAVEAGLAAEAMPWQC